MTIILASDTYQTVSVQPNRFQVDGISFHRDPALTLELRDLTLGTLSLNDPKSRVLIRGSQVDSLVSEESHKVTILKSHIGNSLYIRPNESLSVKDSDVRFDYGYYSKGYEFPFRFDVHDSDIQGSRIENIHPKGDRYCIAGCDARGTSFQRSDLSKFDFTDTILTECRFSGANLVGARLPFYTADELGVEGYSWDNGMLYSAEGVWFVPGIDGWYTYQPIKGWKPLKSVERELALRDTRSIFEALCFIDSQEGQLLFKAQSSLLQLTRSYRGDRTRSYGQRSHS